MALTGLQRSICRLLADRRIAVGERYIAGGLALNEALGGARVSPDHAGLTMIWRRAIAEAREMVQMLPPQQIGTAVLEANGTPFSGDVAALERALAADGLLFHAGAIRVAVPTVRSTRP